MTRRRSAGPRFGLVVTAMILAASSCREEESLSIGYVGTLSGRYFQLGISARDGFLTAVKEVNDAGGVNGCRVHALIENDMGIPEECERKMRSLFDSGVVAIVGPLTSNMISAVRDVAGPGTLVVSPTMTTEALTGLDDGFLRVIPDTGSQGRIAAGLLTRRNVASASVVCDESNSQYSAEVSSAFRDYFCDENHRILGVYQYGGDQNGYFDRIVRDLTAEGPEAVVLATSGTDAAMIVQSLRKSGYEGLVVGSLWVRMPDFLAHGGRTAEGVLTVGTPVPSDATEGYLDFAAVYEEQFGRSPDFAALYSYEATLAILAAAEGLKDVRPDSVKAALLGSSFDMVGGHVYIDDFGDAERLQGYSIVSDGKFVDYAYEDP